LSQVEGLEQQKEIEDLQVRRNMGAPRTPHHMAAVYLKKIERLTPN
jgi:hypothetical protein